MNLPSSFYGKQSQKIFHRGGTNMELADIRNELEKTAKKLADFRGSL